MCEPTEWLSEPRFPSPIFFNLLRRLSVSRNPYLLLITGTSTGRPALDLNAPVPRLHIQSTRTKLRDRVELRVFRWCSYPMCPPTVHMCSIHKTHCFPQRNRLRSSRRFLLRVQCPSAPSHTLYLVPSTQTRRQKNAFTCSSSTQNTNWDVFLLLRCTLQFGRQSGTKWRRKMKSAKSKPKEANNI